MIEQLRAWLAIFVIRCIGSLSILRARKLGALLGWLGAPLSTRMARTTRVNIQRCLPELNATEAAKLTRASLAHTGMVAAEVCSIFVSPRPVAAYLTGTDGAGLVHAHLALGRGLLVLAPHLGNWEVLGLYLTGLAQVTNLYQPPKLKGLDALVRNARQNTGAKLVPTNARGVSALLKALKAGGICGILPDQNPNERASGEFAPFFGYPAFTMTLVHKLLIKTGAKAVFAFAKRVDGGFELVFREPPEGIYSTDTATSLAALNQGVADLVREAPEQYQWEYKRFKVQPDGEKAIY